MQEGERNILPVYEIEKQLVEALSRNERVIIKAPTGAGKSTQVPQMLIHHGLAKKRIIVLQPRRLPTRMLAKRVAYEMNSSVGYLVGYQIRFEDRSSHNTKIKFVTEGILLRQMMLDPGLEDIDAIIFDEFHERHIYSDVTLGRALQIQKTIRPDLKIIVMSATLDIAGLESYLAPCRLISSTGRQYPVAISYLDKQVDSQKTQLWDLCTRELERILSKENNGDVLIFMPGSYEISRTIQALRNSSTIRHCEILPLYGDLPPDRQDAAMISYDRRKIIVATNVAETSLTINGITVVIDSGLARIAHFDSSRGINTLMIEKISRASADQRSGRAGRTAPGNCLRLWTQSEHAARPERETPEIKRIDLSETLLAMHAGGEKNIKSFPWFEPPDQQSIEKAETLLADLGAVDDTGNITPLGMKLSAFPVHPRYARMLIAAGDYGCIPSIALVAAMTQERNILLTTRDKIVSEKRDRRIEDSPDSDFLTLANAWEYAYRQDFDLSACREVGIHAVTARTVAKLQDYFIKIAEREGLDTNESGASHDTIAKCILLGFSDHVACRINEGSRRCELVHKRRGDLAKESSVNSGRLLVACDVSEIGRHSGDSTVILRLATLVKQEWLKELFPSDFTEKYEAVLDPQSKRVIGEKRILFRDLVIERKTGGQPLPEAAAELLAKEILTGHVTLKGWDHEVEQLVARINLIAGSCPELGIKPFGEQEKESVISRACIGSFSIKDVKDKPILPILKNWMSSDLFTLLNKHAPERITLKNGNIVKVVYKTGAEPYIAQTIQKLYGVKESIYIAMKKVPVLIHILAPSQRPVQITKDMPGFWRDHYPRIKQELQRKYPKHEWR
ncbi:MAG: ATP-dependent helicase HrpB [Lentisphaerae bacterium RIFOXYA12_FULL_48_11]|nr:MAG: ATP-dependent helicase HrpB [Lentisphaerae bacterium RIFOXYA12_FULL_48_11]